MAENGNLEARIVYRDRRPGSILTGRAFSASTGTERLLKAGGWPSIVGTYAFGVVGVAALAKVIPLRIEFEQIVGATPAEYAWLIALLGVPAALLAAVSGALVDRVGPRATLIASGLIGALAGAGYWAAPSIGAFQAVRLVEGLALVGIFTAGPALLMATTAGQRRIAAMTFWSTYTPTGFSLGLLLGGLFAGTPSWRLTFVCHGALMVFVALMAFGLPRLPAAMPGQESALGRLRDLLGAYRPGPAAVLALVFFLVISVGFGTSTILPSYVARAHEITLARASNLIAGTNLSMIGGALVVAMLLARGAAPRLVMAGLAIGATACGTALFWPGTSLGALVPVLAQLFGEVPPPAKIHVPSIFLSLAVSVGVGVLFGWYPAKRAAMLDPIEALRHE